MVEETGAEMPERIMFVQEATADEMSAYAVTVQASASTATAAALVAAAALVDVTKVEAAAVEVAATFEVGFTAAEDALVEDFLADEAAAELLTRDPVEVLSEPVEVVLAGAAVEAATAEPPVT